MHRKEKEIEALHDYEQRKGGKNPFSAEAEERVLAGSFKRLQRWITSRFVEDDDVVGSE